jgi:hypothetical protein
MSDHAGPTCHLSESTYRLLESYALAATAAGVGILGATSSAEAKIVYTPVHRVIHTGQHYNLDLNHDRIVDFTLRDVANLNTNFDTWWLGANPARGNGARGFRTLQGTQVTPWASALQSGAQIGGGQYFPGELMAVVGTSFVEGSWASVKDRYLGLKFHIGGKVHYGWARLSVSAKVGSITATLTGYAYETIPNKSIKAGQTKEAADFGPGASLTNSISDTPQPASLGALAAGAPGLSIWRRKESTSGVPNNIGDEGL